MKVNTNWFQRRFLDFRNGHSTYLIFFISFVQFVIISYGLYIADNPNLMSIFPTIYHWIAFFVITYVPLAVIIGHYHLKKQYATESRQMMENNPIAAKLFLVLMKAIDGTATEAETTEVKNYLRKIVEKE